MKAFYVRFVNDTIPGKVMVRIRVSASSVEQAIPDAEAVLYGLVQDMRYFAVESVDPA